MQAQSIEGSRRRSGAQFFAASVDTLRGWEEAGDPAESPDHGRRRAELPVITSTPSAAGDLIGPPVSLTTGARGTS